MFLFGNNVQYYSFNRSNSFNNNIKSRKYKIDLFVNDDYVGLSYNDKLKVHNDAEKVYFGNIKQNCQSEYWNYYQRGTRDPYSGVYCKEYKRIQNLSY